MNFSHSQTKYFIYVIFALSGFSGLIYESVWSHYLKLFLGHAAYAQALVLIIFMGGMALGAWVVSRNTHKIRNLLLAYAVIEGIIGFCGLIFHPVYELILNFSFDSVIPALGVPLYVHIYKFFIASLLILPQSILLGATFPLMSGGFIRRFPDAPGKAISLLYFTNSLGAATGLLVCAFYLLENLGLPGTIFTSGIINICIAILVFGLIRTPESNDVIQEKKPARVDVKPRLLLTVAFLTGMASFIYEVAWIRMLSMVLGASTHSFELMLSAFITGLAIGGYWIRKRIDHLKDPVVWVAAVQIAKGLLALSTIFLYGYSFELMSFFMAGLDKTEQGYTLFSLASHSIALLIMLPATICAGMTLPLFTLIMFRQNCGEKSIGQIYSSNTIGAIAGVLFTVFIGMPIFSLKGSILSGVIIDVAIGLVLLKACSIAFNPKLLRYASVALILPVLFAAYFFEFNTRQMASGVFRHGISELDNNSEVLFHKDGKTASITVSRWQDAEVVISTNGKPDATITMKNGLPPSTDESTMTLLAALPLSVHPGARTIANIGMGSGLTSHTALALPDIERIDTIEIEQAIVEGAKFFIPKTSRVFYDDRSNIYIDDARTFFSTRQSKYDLIISEPSNPWVSGVSSLFTVEFYNSVSKHLNNGGLLVQWIHIYEFNLDLLVSIMKAISRIFPYYSVYFADNSNLILLANMNNPIGTPDPSIFESIAMREQLSVIHVNNIEDLKFRFLGDQSLYNPYIKQSAIPANSDYNQYLDLKAQKSRFLEEQVSNLLNIRLSPAPILDILYESHAKKTNNLTTTSYYPTQLPDDARFIYEYLNQNSSSSNYGTRTVSVDNIVSIPRLDYLLFIARTCDQEYDPAIWANSLYRILVRTVAYLTTDQLYKLLAAITPDCGNVYLTATNVTWLDLYRAYIERNHNDLIEMSLKLLQASVDLNIEQGKFLYTSILLGLIKSGEHEQASILWEEYMDDLFDEIPLEIELLLAQIRK
jgi:spermidine synthase